MHLQSPIFFIQCKDFKRLIDLRALTLAGPLWHKSVPDPLAVQLLENWLCMWLYISPLNKNNKANVTWVTRQVPLAANPPWPSRTWGRSASESSVQVTPASKVLKMNSLPYKIFKIQSLAENNVCCLVTDLPNTNNTVKKELNRLIVISPTFICYLLEVYVRF